MATESASRLLLFNVSASNQNFSADMYGGSRMATESAVSLLSNISASNQNFSADMYGLMARGGRSVIFSPISIQLVLMMLYLGARGKTANEIAKGLRLPSNNEGYFNAVKEYSTYLTKKPQLNLTFGIFLDTRFKIEDEYRTGVQRYFDAELHSLDFLKDPEGSRKYINDLVSKQTHDKIKNLLPYGIIKPPTKLVLTNAIYFKEQWKLKFSESATRKSPFYLSNGEKREVNMMRKQGFYAYMEREHFQVLELPYKDEDFSMVIILPNKPDGIDELEKTLKNFYITSVLNDMTIETVSVSIPKFKLEVGVVLNEVLKKLGMESMFDENDANLSGINKYTRLKVSAAVHKGFIEVTEEGVEASAATGVVIYPLKAAPPPPRPRIFNADHPFVFYILNRPKNVILFMGRFMQP